MSKLWTSEEVDRAKMLFSTGMTWVEVGRALGRSASACLNAVSRHSNKILTARSCYDGPPIPKTMECQKREQDCKLGSAILRETILDLFCRTANRRNISLDEAAALHLKPIERVVIPGTERIYKTASAQRLAA